MSYKILGQPVEKVEELTGPYFGYGTFHDYFLATSLPGGCWRGKTEAEAWASVEEKLQTGYPTDCARRLVGDAEKRPGRRYRAQWYFVMPEARATIPKDLLEKVDELLVR